MIKTKNFLFAFCLLFAFSFTNGQTSLLNYIPSDATFVVSWNPQNLNSKVNLRQLKEYDFYNMMMMQMAGSMGAQSEMFTNIMADANSVGMNLMQSSHFFGKMAGDNMHFGVLLNLSDEAKFTDFLKNLMQDGYTTNYSQQVGYHLLKVENNAWLAWNDQMAFMGGGKFESALDESETAESQYMADWLTETMSRKVENSIANNARFRQAISKPSDAHFWLDYAFITEQMNSGMYEGLKNEIKGFDPEMVMGMIKSFYEDNNISLGLNFDKGKIAINTQSFTSPQMLAITKNAVDHKFNKKLAKYIRGDELMGYMSFSMSTEKLMEGYKKLIYSKVAEIPGYGDMAVGALDILSIFLDENAMPNLFQGDMIMAMTGMQKIQKTIIDTEFDEDFNPIGEVEKTIEQNIPEVTMIWSHKSKSDWMKFVNLGLKSAFLENKGSYYQLMIPAADLDAYIALKDDVLIISNSVDLITKKLDRGYKKKSRISKAHCQKIAENSFAMHFDMNNIIKQIEAGEANLLGNNDNLKIVKENFESIEITSSKEVGNYINGEFSINLVNKDVNSLKHIFEMINELMYGMMGGSKT